MEKELAESYKNLIAQYLVKRRSYHKGMSLEMYREELHMLMMGAFEGYKDIVLPAFGILKEDLGTVN